MGGSGFKTMSKDKNRTVSVSMKLPIGVTIKSVKTTKLFNPRGENPGAQEDREGGAVFLTSSLCRLLSLIAVQLIPLPTLPPQSETRFELIPTGAQIVF